MQTLGAGVVGAGAIHAGLIVFARDSDAAAAGRRRAAGSCCAGLRHAGCCMPGLAPLGQ
ncbi:MAG TPA: hypothetical protein VHN80_14430 [Kineosporiaceae bacterium]|nr:hypothetical protein [Kineosporiaceae bacterium]